MKKQTIEVYCDVCGKKSDINTNSGEYDFSAEHSATIDFNFGYGSEHDTFHNEYHLCTVHAEELLKLVREKWPNMITDKDMEKHSYIGECVEDIEA